MNNYILANSLIAVSFMEMVCANKRGSDGLNLSMQISELIRITK